MSATPLSAPERWSCPKCGTAVLVYAEFPERHVCLPGVRTPAPRTFWYYYVLGPDHEVRELHLVNALADDPLLRVEGFDAEGRCHRWYRHERGGELVFTPFDPARAVEHVLGYSPQLQRHEPLPRAELERRALRGRHTA